MIVIIDYDAGNLRNVYNALKNIGVSAKITNNPEDIISAEKIILPGVGAFSFAYNSLVRRGLIEPILNQIARGTPFLGICLGLQLLFEYSEEGNEKSKGFSAFKGYVKRFGSNVVVPHIGWNQIKILKTNPLLKGIPDESYFYFVHSYFVVPSADEIISTQTEYDGSFCSMIWKDNIFATQFHPEKSQKKGLQFLKNFVEL